jgi:hypothetical protein
MFQPVSNIGRFDLWLMSLCRTWVVRSKWSDSNGIRKLTSISFYTNMAWKKKGWKSQPSKTCLAFCQFWPSAIPTWLYWVGEVHLIQTQFFYYFELKYLSTYQISAEKSSYKIDMIFRRQLIILPADKFCEETSPTYLNADCLL